MRACPACGLPALDSLFEKNGFSVLGCRCGTAFVAEPPKPAELRDYYSLDYFKGNREKFGYIDYAAEEPFQAESFQRKAERLGEILGGGRVLDVGCATSSFLKQLGPGWEKHGVELSVELLKAYPPPEDVKVWSGDFLAYPKNEKPFDAVTLWEVLDHVPEPKSVVRKSAELLRPGGVLAVLVGDRSSCFARLLGKRWHLYIPPTHLTFFTRASLLELLKCSGFKTIRHEYEGRWVPLSLCFFRLSYILEAAWVRKLYEWSLRSAVRNLKIYINLRDVVTVYASK